MPRTDLQSLCRRLEVGVAGHDERDEGLLALLLQGVHGLRQLEGLLGALRLDRPREQGIIILHASLMMLG